MELLLYICASVLIVWLANRWRYRASLRLANTVPSNRWQRLLGFGELLLPKNIIRKTYEYSKKYGMNSVVWTGPYPLFLTTDPQTLKEILTSKNCVDKPVEFYKGIITVAGQGLITENEPFWSQHRKLVNKAFSHKMLLSLLPTFNTEIDNLVNDLQQSMDKGEDIDLLVKLRVLTLKNSTRTTLKRNMDFTNFNSTSMTVYFGHILEMVIYYSLNPFLTHRWCRNILELHSFQEGAKGIREFFKLFEESLKIARRPDASDKSFLANENSILDCFLQVTEKNNFKQSEIEGLLMQFFVAAFESSSTTLYFALLLLAMYPEYQDRVHEEISKVMNDDGSELSIAQLDELIYLEMIFNETMRVLPTVPIVFRKVSNTDLTLSNDITLPVGQIIAVDIFHLHRSKALWGPEAETFNPDNFLPANVAARHPYAFIPFTKGQRFCIGWRYATLFFKMSAAKLIQSFKFSTDFEFKNLRFENHITLHLVETPRLKLERRNVSE